MDTPPLLYTHARKTADETDGSAQCVCVCLRDSLTGEWCNYAYIIMLSLYFSFS